MRERVAEVRNRLLRPTASFGQFRFRTTTETAIVSSLFWEKYKRATDSVMKYEEGSSKENSEDVILCWGGCHSAGKLLGSHPGFWFQCYLA